MYIEFYNKLVGYIPIVLDGLGLPPSDILEIQNYFRMHIPLVEPCPDYYSTLNKPELICIGSPVSINLANHLKKLNFDVEPSYLSRKFLSLLDKEKSDSLEYKLGKGVYINLVFSSENLRKYVLSIIGKESQDLFITKLVQSIEDREKFDKAFRKRLESKSAYKEFIDKLETLPLSEDEKLISKCQFLSDDDFDFDKINYHCPVKDSPHQILREVKNFIKNFNKGRDFLIGEYYSDFHRRDHFKQRLQESIKTIENYILEIRYLEMEACTRKRPDILWMKCYDIITVFNSLMNDTLFLRLVYEQYKSNSDINYLIEMVGWTCPFWDSFCRECVG